MSNFQETYQGYVKWLEELKEKYKKLQKAGSKNPTLIEVLRKNIEELQIVVDRAKEYIERSELLASEATELKRKIETRDRKIGELEELYRDIAIYITREISSANGIDEALASRDKNKERLQRVSEILNSMSEAENPIDYTQYSLRDLDAEFDKVVSLRNSDKERLDEIYREIEKNKIDIRGDSEERVSDTSTVHEDENDVRTDDIGGSSRNTGEDEIGASREQQGGTGEETHSSNFASTDIERDIEAIKEARAFKDMVYKRKEHWDKISEIRNVRLQTGNYRADASQMKSARETVKRQDNFIRTYINEFSKNYEIPDELTELIGIRDESRDKRDGNFGGTLTRPTVKQHLEPIEDIEKKLYGPIIGEMLRNYDIKLIEKEANNIFWSPEIRKFFQKALYMTEEEKEDYMKLKEVTPEEEKNMTEKEKEKFILVRPLTPEEEKKLSEEKEKRERRLGKKWLIKLKIDKLNAEIKSLEAELKTANPERKEEIMKILATKRSALASLEMQYGDILAEIGELVSETVEKSILEKNGVKSLEELEQKVKQSKEASKPERGANNPEIRSQKSNLNNPIPDNRVAGVSPAVGANSGPAVAGNGGPAVGGNGVQYPQYSSVGGPSVKGNNDSAITRGESSTNSSNLPEKKKTFRDRIAGIFNRKKGEKTENEKNKEYNDDNILYRKKLEYDFTSLYATFPIAKVDGEYFYHAVKKDDELLYVREPLKDIECTERGLVAKIEELQKKFGDGHKVSIVSRLYEGIANIAKDESIREEEYNEKMKNPENYLTVSPKTIVKKLLGKSKGEERKMRILKMMCGLEAVHLKSEAISAISEGMPIELFNPSIGIDEKGLIDIVDPSLLSPEFGKMIEGINTKNKEESNERIKKRISSCRGGSQYFV